MEEVIHRYSFGKYKFLIGTVPVNTFILHIVTFNVKISKKLITFIGKILTPNKNWGERSCKL